MMIYGRVVDSPTLLYKGIEKIHNLLLINCEICQGCPRRPCGPGVMCLLNGFSPFLSLKILHCCSAVEIVFNNDRNTADAQFTMVWITTLQWCTSNAQSVEAVLDSPPPRPCAKNLWYGCLLVRRGSSSEPQLTAKPCDHERKQPFCTHAALLFFTFSAVANKLHVLFYT